MSLHRMTQTPLSHEGGHKTEIRTQIAALCFRVTGDKPQFLLVTSRGSGKWIFPKGWPIDGLTPARTALQEAYEEAGVAGRAFDTCLGVYPYSKILDRNAELPCLVMVYPVRVKNLERRFPEDGERRRKWFGRKKAAKRVLEPELRHIIETFDPRRLKG